MLKFFDDDIFRHAAWLNVKHFDLSRVEMSYDIFRHRYVAKTTVLEKCAFFQNIIKSLF